MVVGLAKSLELEPCTQYGSIGLFYLSGLNDYYKVQVDECWMLPLGHLVSGVHMLGCQEVNGISVRLFYCALCVTTGYFIVFSVWRGADFFFSTLCGAQVILLYSLCGSTLFYYAYCVGAGYFIILSLWEQVIFTILCVGAHYFSILTVWEQVTVLCGCRLFYCTLGGRMLFY